ncbi:hypothetical protein V496_07437 [Pseudogymnoascus sp. VKM F-4515 (FW-2607)]|nr:hypothetical protein V496_07437 [Pseudogymnoascus sp. VKM F-4515 (FW-2607)]KFY96165.1 hypothetical protein V498_02855 [Pseudogymnoascus sp. VKM F-4517 (FW-2822)]
MGLSNIRRAFLSLLLSANGREITQGRRDDRRDNHTPRHQPLVAPLSSTFLTPHSSTVQGESGIGRPRADFRMAQERCTGAEAHVAELYTAENRVAMLMLEPRDASQASAHG